MAGVGLELRKMLAKDSYAGLLGAYGYAGLVSSGPWVASVVGVLVIGLVAGRATPAEELTRFFVSVTWSTAASLVLTGPLQLVFGRFVADRIYERRRDRILPNLLGALGVATLASGALGSLVVFTAFEEPLVRRALLVANFVVLCDGWVMLVLLSGVKAYRAIAGVFLAAQLVAIAGATALRRFGLEGLLAGFASGQAGALFGMLILVLHAFPGERCIRLDFLRPSPARLELAAIGLVFYLGTWADKAVFWLSPGTSDPVIGPLRASLVYDLPFFLATLSAIPAMAAFFLRLEADFAQRCEEFLGAVRGGAPLDEIERIQDGMVACARRGFIELLEVQGVTLVLVFAAGPAVLSAVRISPLTLRLFQIDAAAVALQVVFLAILNVLFYLDERKPALALSGLFAGGNLVFTLVTQRLGPDGYGFGFAGAALLASAAGLPVLSRKLERLERETFMRQPLWPAACPARWRRLRRAVAPREIPGVTPSRRFTSLKERVMKMARCFLAVAVVSLVPGTGSAQLPPLPVDPGTCIGPVCLPPLEDISLGPVAFPTVPSLPLGPTPPPPAPPPPPPGCTSVTVGMRVLVISADGREPVLPAIQQALDHHSVPYSTWIASQRPGRLTSAELASDCDGKYQGVVLTTGGLAYSPDGGTTWASGLTSEEWIALRSYEAGFGIREVSWYVYPGADQGLNPPSAGRDPGQAGLDTTLTAAGKAVFPYVNAANPIPITYAWTYFATPAEASVTPLLVDAAGNALISSRRNADGRETLALTFDSNPYLLHHAILAHGLVEWVTKGIYLGEFRVYLTPQVDDLFIDDDMYSAGRYPGGVYRLTATDMTAVQLWQTRVQAIAGNTRFRLAFAFNGSGAAFGDPLTLVTTPVNGAYHFINHTFTHENLDALDYATAFDEIERNDRFARDQPFLHYSTANLVTPDVSGLENPEALSAAVDVGVRYTVSDTSRAGWDNPRPNLGIYSTIEPTLLHIPRRPTNLFYNVAMPDEWVAEYNAFYATYWGRNLTYAEILDKESQFLLFYMLRGDLDPQMYHQPNLKAYDGVHSLLGDLHDLAIQKLRRHSKLPVVSPDMHVAGKRMANTMARNASGLVATFTPGVNVSFSSPVDVQFALSGVCTSGSERYAGKCITTVNVGAGQTVALPIQ